ncbi:unnamed protein product [Urochloa decumbens]|uniref:Receptor-like serine/threonine-protein kinase n=1 Tax=Urochloa decumbens TaxID=240449 RepID=A0ABC9DNE4_9POAL
MDTHRHSTSLFILVLIHLLLHVLAHDFLLPGSSLSVEHSSDVLASPDGTFTCGFYNFSFNATVFSIWFSESAEKTVVWSANHLHPVYTWGSRVELDIHGGMAVKDYNGQIAWTNNVSSSDADRAQLLDTGNLIIKGKGDIILWQSFDSPTDTLLPKQNITATTKLVATQTLLVPSHYSFHFDDQHILTLFDDEKDISFIYWPNPNINIWEKQRNSFNSTTIGVLDSSGHFLGSDNLNFTASDSGSGIMRRLTLDFDGNLRLYSMDKNGTWMVSWMAYSRLCYVRGLCGTNGICVYTPVPACTCAPGYEAVDRSDGRKGCKPKHIVSCDGSQKMRFVKLPNTNFLGYDQDVRHFVSLQTCRSACMRTCSCMGFIYVQGMGDCYTKSAIIGGVTNPALPFSAYIKLPRDVEVLQYSIPYSQPFGPKYISECSAISTNVTDFLDRTGRSHNGPKYWYVYGFLSAIFLVEVIFFLLGWWFILRREGKRLRGVHPAEVGYEMITNHFRRYTHKELQRATRKFTHELGRGASGVVYKGILEDKREVAVKKLSDVHHGEAEFQHELSVIGRIYHMNLVRIWGFCSDSPHRILVSEFVENGSLDKTLFRTEGSQILLEWKQRFNIALGVAKGLAYLHHECLEWVIHCDVKPENILLDENMEPKITDFGLAKLLNRGGSNISISRICGTRGYIAPEWVSTLPITAKVDVYSFGVVLLELLKGARVSEWAANADEAVEVAIGRIARTLDEKATMPDSEQAWMDDFIDLRLNGHFNGLQAKTMIKLAVSCLQEDRNRRPTMENVVQKLLSVDEADSSTQNYSLN